MKRENKIKVSKIIGLIEIIIAFVISVIAIIIQDISVGFIGFAFGVLGIILLLKSDWVVPEVDKI